ncbi:hypothetical protein BVU17_18295 (plasmid) [Haloarcula taiwanensis]|uniref:Schlafen AlbA-2 domain-containing protein n=1 Tax=Haloarcula taiwanensis TaxID=1932004 RepID=A0A2H5A483_9EURY|nr:ATP-binding protein [Haloarcula taiwanensis]AUG49533.1 hypothetical protein BVU17_18295 [Haloarcula taiwanensis]
MDVSELIEAEIRENEQLEYKSTSARPSGIVKELVALANQEGGRVIVGVDDSDGKIATVEDVEANGDPGGLEEALHNSIRDTVDPVIELEFGTVEYQSKTLIEIAVEDANVLHSWRPSGKPTFPIRHGSTTRYLSGFEIARAYGHLSSSNPAIETVDGLEQKKDSQTSTTDQTRQQDWSGGVYRTATTETLPTPETPVYSAPENRLIVESGGRQIVNFGQISLDPFQIGHSTVRLEDSINLMELSELPQCLQSIDTKLTTASYQSYSYSIKYGPRQLVGRGLENFIEDAYRISKICDRLTPGNKTADDRVRPIGVLSFPVSGGVGILELQWDGDTLRRGRSSIQLLMQNIPFNTAPYKELSDEWGWNPRGFQEQTRLQLLRINGDAELQETQQVTFNPSAEFVQEEIVAANPFYESPEQVASPFDIEVPEYLSEALAGINRLPFDIAGGLHPDDKTFTFDSMEVLHLDGLLETFIIYSLGRVASTDADIPELEMPFYVSDKSDTENN